MAEGARLLLFCVLLQVALELGPPVVVVASRSRILRSVDAAAVSGGTRIYWAALALATAAAAIVVRVQQEPTTTRPQREPNDASGGPERQKANDAQQSDDFSGAYLSGSRY